VTVVLKFALNLVTAMVLFVVFRTVFGLVPTLQEPVMGEWGIGDVMALFGALYLVSMARRRLPLFQLRAENKQ